jgi:hypothetical protein
MVKGVVKGARTIAHCRSAEVYENDFELVRGIHDVHWFDICVNHAPLVALKQHLRHPQETLCIHMPQSKPVAMGHKWHFISECRTQVSLTI